MKLAQISLASYFVSELHFAANRDFDSSKPQVITVADYEIMPRAEAIAKDRRMWEVELRVALPACQEKNFPCNFEVKLLGIIQVDETVNDEYIPRFVNINGVALVFGVAREIIRSITSAGPTKSVLLPSVTFWEPKISPPPVAAAPSSSPSPASAVVETATSDL